MNYLFPGKIADHFRANGNMWNSARDIAAATGTEPVKVNSQLSSFRKRGNLEIFPGKPTMYRINPEVLYLPKSSQQEYESGMRVERARERFCKKHGVRIPYQATSKSQAALTEWCEMLR